MGATSIEAQPALQSRIPEFGSVEEEAEFWDTHSIEEFADELEEVDNVVMIGLMDNGRLYLWLEPEVAATLTERAKAEGTRPARLARRYILERLGYPGDLGEESN